MNPIHRTDLLQSISQVCSNIPYLDYGRGYAGADCWGLVYLIYKDFLGITLDRYDGDYDIEDKCDVGDHVLSTIKDDFEEVDEPQQGDIVVLRILGQPWHCGVFFTGNQMMHTQKGIGVTVESLSSKKWNKRVVGFYRPCR